jgi:hypothetical protein
MNNQNPLAKIIETLNVLETIENCDYSRTSERFNEVFYLNFSIFKKKSNDHAMMIFKEQLATMRLEIRIDCAALFREYSRLDEEKKIPKNYEILNPCLNDEYMNNFIEGGFLEIIQNLKIFNGISDNYDVICRLIGKYHGYHSGKFYGI